MKVFKFLMKILICYACISITVSFSKAFFTDSIFVQIYGGFLTVVMAAVTIGLIVTFFKKKKYQPCYYNQYPPPPPPMNQQQCGSRTYDKQQRSNRRQKNLLFGLFLIFMSIFAFARSLRHIK